MPARRQRWFRDRRRVASAVVVALVVGTIAALSLNYRGVATADVDLNDGGVWVTNDNSVLIGRLNYPVRKIDAAFAALARDIDVIQREDEALMLDGSAGTVRRVDTANVVFTGAAVPIPAGADIGLGDAAVAVLDPADGRLWVTSPSTLAIIAEATVPATYEVGEGAHMTIADDGTVFVLDVIDNEILTFTPEVWGALSAAAADEGAEAAEGGSPASAEPEASDGEPAEDASEAVPDATVLGEDVDLTNSDVQIAAIGDAPVVLARDRETGATTLLQPDADPIDLTGLGLDLTGAVLQATSVSGTSAVIATNDGVAVVPLDGGEPRVEQVQQTGTPVQPVQVNGCVHAAWAGDVPTYLRICGDGDAEPQAVPEALAGTELAFRVNRTNVVLNDLRTGDVWMLEDQLILVDNWEEINSQSTEETETDKPSEERTDEVPLDREAENQDPVAEPDDVGARPGRTVVLPVLDNDSDPDGDLLVVQSVTQPPESFGVIERILGGRALQVRIADGATGAAEVEYTINDGRGGDDTTTLTIAAHGPGQNTAPFQTDEITPQVSLGESVEVNVLDDVRDPDGDEVYLVSVETDETLNARLRPDGIVTLTDAAVTTGPKQVTVMVSDGLAAPVPVTIDLQVLPDGQQPPVAVFDFSTGFVGERIEVSPLVNDIDPDGKPLVLAYVEPTTGGEVVQDSENGTFTFEAGSAGSHYVLYTVTDDDGLTDEGLVRIDVVAPREARPVAVRDTALLPPGGSVAVDVLDNDTDPGGGVLAVQSIDIPPGYGLQVAILDHRVLRITSERTLNEPVTIGYTVSNGVTSAEGEVVVIPLTSDADTQPPTPEADQAAVRVDDYVTIPVLRNDSHPNGLEFEITSLDDTDDVPGLPFISGDVVRYAAPSEPGTYRFSYSVTDEAGQADSAQITIYVEARGDEVNAPPRPADVEVRAFAGERIRIPIDLYGIDPDGDSVQLVGPITSPERGRIADVGAGYLDYVAYNAVDGGTDSFDIAVRDRLGEIGVATVTVGVIPPPTTNRDPVATDERIVVRPDRAIQADVLANDTDPDGDQLQFGSEAVIGSDGIEVTTEDGMLSFVSPSEPDSYTIQYQVTDNHGGDDVGTLTVAVDPNADPLPPVAVDDVVPATALIDAENVDVDVLDNDRDPDGSTDDLVVEVPDAADGVVVLDDGRVRIPVPQTRQVVTYKITDPDGESTYAFIEVPGLTDTGPVLRPDTMLEVNSGEELVIDLTEHVVSLTGGDIRLYDNDGVTATNSNGGPYVLDASTLTYTSADGYFGQASITFEVTDAPDINATGVLTSVLTIPITVIPTTAQPPTFRNGSLAPEAGGDPETLDLGRLAADPDTETADLTFDIGDVPAGFSAQIEDGLILVASTALDTPPGTTGELPVIVSDGENEVEGVVTLTATETSADPIVAVDDDLGEIYQGESVTIDVLANDTDPVPPRTIVDAHAESGSGDVTISGSELTITPSADFDGRLVIVYTVQDGTEDPDRWAEARVTATVLGAPDTPSRPIIGNVGSREVTLDITPPNNNGAPITAYEVSTNDGQVTTCSSTTCRFTGLTNDVTYTFTVVAINEVGRSEPSAASAEARPDQAPDPVAAPSVQYDDSQLRLSWRQPNNEGSDIVRYDIQIRPATGGPTQVDVDGGTLQYTWSGLQNGTEYQFRIRAVNDAPDPGDWGEWSRPEYPSAPPAAPAAPTMERIDNPAGGQVQASWTAPADNGDSIDVYHVTLYRDGASYRTVEVGAGTTTRVFDVENGHDYSVSVVAENRSGRGPSSPQSSAVTSFGQPGQVGGVSIRPTGNSGQLEVTYGTPDDNGQAIRRFEYQLVSGGSGSGTLGASPAVIGGLANGTSYTLQVRACNTYCGSWSAVSNAASPYAPPATPPASGSISSSRGSGEDGRTVSFAWNYPANSNGAAITAAQIRIDGDQRNANRTGSVTATGDWEQNHTFQLRVQNEHGQWSDWSTVRNQRAGADPTPPNPPGITAIQGDKHQSSTCTDSSCAYLAFTYRNLPNASYSIVMSTDGPYGFSRSYSATLSGDGRWQVPSGGAHFGYPGATYTVVITGGGNTYRDSMTWPNN